MAPFAPRIHVLLASRAPLGVVIRRGPSKCVCTILWDRRDDTFVLGQWLKGRIYERRSDLSPDGKLLIYFAMNGKWQSKAQGAWTAISRAPYLKAVSLFAKGDCWQGGGLFTGNRRLMKRTPTFWLNGRHTTIHDANIVARDRFYKPAGGVGAECLGVYYPRLIRDGWKLVEHETTGRWQNKDAFDKPLRFGWVLRKHVHAGLDHSAGRGCYWDEHEIVNARSGQTLACPTWEWAEPDGARLVWAAQGKLFAGDILGKGLSNEVELHDFNNMQFEAIAAPY